MRIPRFYCETSLHSLDTLSLEGQAAHHLLRVLRRRVGDALCLFDGYGGEYEATVQATSRNSVELSIEGYSAENHDSPLHSHLGLALSKGERMDWAIQKCTELGINAVTPLISERCAVRLQGDRQDKKIEHWRRIARSACEQCGRNRLPTISPPMPLNHWLETIDVDQGLICHPQGSGLEHSASASGIIPSSVAILVGPEGGFTAEEIECARQSSFQLTRFGPRTMRTETAPVAILSIAQYLWGDLAE